MTDEKVNHPKHYNIGSIEVIDIIEDWDLNFNVGNVLKYVMRAKHKNGWEDLEKAKWYLIREIERMKVNKKKTIVRGGNGDTEAT